MNSAAQPEDDRLHLLAVAGSWSALFLVCLFAYWPGLNGPFVFDDFGTIADLGKFGGIRDWETFKAFVFGGHAGPTGRPLALLSFLIDANSWPADPWPFKRTNLAIHLINGALLGVLTTRILGILEFNRNDARWIALASAACWLLHPFLVSTTLYAVQRMAQLSALFVFSGLVTYLYGRSLVETNAQKAYVIMSVSIIVFTFLGVICKENAVLLPLLIGVLETTVLSGHQPRLAGVNRYWSFAFILMPTTALAVYLGGYLISSDFFEIVPPRDFTAYERLLTQPRILVDYLQHWFVPELYTTGVFQDHFIKSTGILSPLTTLMSVLLHLSLISLALIKRHSWPLFSLAALFFYVSHILESSVLNLELYFEHRNYLAVAFLFLPIIALSMRRVRRPYFLAIVAALLLTLAGFTRYSAMLWSDYPAMVEASARKAPTSARAQSQYAANLHDERRYDEALRVIDRAIEYRPNDESLLIVRSIIRCNIGALDGKNFEAAATALSARIYDPRLTESYLTLTSLVADNKCPEVSLAALHRMFANMLAVSENRDPRGLQFPQIKYFIGLINARLGAPQEAVAAFEASLQSRPGASFAMHMAAILATNNHFDEALNFSDIAMTYLSAVPSGLLPVNRVSEDDIAKFRATVRADREAARMESSDSLEVGPDSDR